MRGQLLALFVGALARRTHAAVFADNYWLSFDCRKFYSRKVEMYGSFIHAQNLGDPPEAKAGAFAPHGRIFT